MKQSSRLIDYLIFTLLFLLVFFLVFERFLVLPSFVQVLGRSHPLFLHLPIGFLILLGLLPLLKRQIQDGSLQVFRSFLLDIATLSLVLTALAGLFLAQEEGYQSASVNWHKWTAAAVSFITYGLLLWNRYFPDRKQVYYPMLYTNLVLLLVAGHIGGGLTHGKDFLLAPVKAEQAKAITENMAVYAAMVQPILDAKCVKCHSDAKSKGDLILIDQENILAGGKHGPVIIAGNVDSSSLIQRLNLPMEDEYHMPPEDQTQVNQSELQLLTEWVKAGADFTQTIEAVGQSTPLFAALKPIWEKTNQAKAQAQYDFPPLKNSTLSKLNTPFRTVRPTANGSPALSAKFFIAQSYQPIFLKELLVAKDQVTNINLSSMPIQADAFEILGQFPLLEKLLLNSTP
ncbi:MAG: c-type cytochrome domain-containing protein, partial [Bacteroidota bacterium]